MIKYLLLLVSAGLLGCSGKQVNNEKSSEKEKQPNLILIQTDEHNFRTLGCYRDQLSHEQAFIWGEDNVVETPNIDFLAENGVLFNKYYAASPVCSPSRGTLISGLYSHQTGVPKNDVPMNDDVVTYSEVLSKAGYKTGFVGKWHLNGEGKPEWEPSRKFGFDDNRYMFNRGHWKKYELTEEGPQIAARDDNNEPTYNLNGADEKSFSTDWLTNRAIDFIETNKEHPFSIYLSLPDPHGPDAVRPPYSEMYKHMKFEKPRTFNLEPEKAPSWAKPEKNPKLTHDQYFGMVKCIDDNVGKLITYLRENDLLENTIIVFTSDHGDLRAEHGKHNKGNPLEASAKIPFIFYYPNKIPSGKVVNNALNTVDFTPTILNFMNQEVPAQMVGKDFSELLTNPDSQIDFEDVTILRNAGALNSANWIAAVTSRYKLILSKNDEPWLVDMEIDPDEKTNFISKPENVTVVKELAEKLLQYGKEQADPYLSGTKLEKDLLKLIQ